MKFLRAIRRSHVPVNSKRDSHSERTRQYRRWFGPSARARLRHARRCSWRVATVSYFTDAVGDNSILMSDGVSTQHASREKATALKAEVWVETVTEGGRRFMAAWRKEEVDAGRHRQEKREATRLGNLVWQTGV